MIHIKCYIYGAGEEYNRLASYLPVYQEKIKILGIVTTRKQAFDILDGLPCIQPEEMQINEMDYVIIAIQRWQEVYDLLKNFGVGDEKILRSHIFYLPNFDLEEYLKLKKNNVSILANSCLAGIVYKELGLKTLSPTINASCPNGTYIEFLKHYSYYLSMDMEIYSDYQCKNDYDREMFRPTGIIDNKIVWHFPHVVKIQEGIETWNRKRKHVNCDNIAVLMVIYTDKDAEEFEKLPIKKKLGFYHKDFGLESVLYCPEWENEETRFQHEFLWHRYVHAIRNCIDWIKFLNGKDNFIRYK